MSLQIKLFVGFLLYNGICKHTHPSKCECKYNVHDFFSLSIHTQFSFLYPLIFFYGKSIIHYLFQVTKIIIAQSKSNVRRKQESVNKF